MSSRLENEAAFEATTLAILYRQFTRPKVLPASFTLRDQTAIVTGSNTGLGLEASRQLLRFGVSHLVMGVRSESRGQEAAVSLRREYPDATISIWTIDMESYDSVRAFVARCKTLPRIDVTILNAAVMRISHSIVPGTGHETSLQVNYLSTVLLATLLLPVLKTKSTSESSHNSPILSIIGSDLAYKTVPNIHGPIWSQFDASKGYDQFTWYGRTKFLLTMFFTKLAEQVDPEEVIINMPNPGSCKGTSFFREFPAFVVPIWSFLQFCLSRTVEVGASTYLDAISRGREGHGSFLSDWTFKPFPLVWYSAEGQKFSERLWEETMEELNFAGVSKIVLEMKK